MNTTKNTRTNKNNTDKNNTTKNKTKNKNELIIKDLHVSVDGVEILKGVSLQVREGEVVALMGPNGSGKSTLASTLMGHPNYQITSGAITFNGKEIQELETHERAKLGIFLSFQYPAAISGVTVSNFLRAAYRAVKGKDISVLAFQKLVKEKMQFLEVGEQFTERYLNEGFSGGEKKKNEILQMSILEPKIAILDETDSGLDVDAIKIVAKGVNAVTAEHKTGILIITHYERILEHIVPDRVYIMYQGTIAKEGGRELAHEIEKKGYDFLSAGKIVLR